jgi:hypothetical protein
VFGNFDCGIFGLYREPCFVFVAVIFELESRAW